MVIDKRRVLFVGGIPSSMTEDVIRDHFSRYDLIVNVRIMKDRKTRGSKGYAFVTLTDHLKIPAILDEPQIIDGRTVDVQVASRRGEKEKWKEEQKKKRLFVSNLPSHIGNEYLLAYFSNFGEVRNAYVIRDFVTKHSLNYGYVEFVEAGITDSLINSEDLSLDGSQLVCMPYQGRNQEKKLTQQSIPRADSKLSSKKPSEARETLISEQQEKSTSVKPTQKQLFTTKKDSESAREEVLPISRSLGVANSKYEYLEKCILLNQDESNYSFKLKKDSLNSGSNSYLSPLLRGTSTFNDPILNSPPLMLTSFNQSATFGLSGFNLSCRNDLSSNLHTQKGKKNPALTRDFISQENYLESSGAFKLF